MTSYEVLVETITPCGGERHASKEFIDVDTNSPEAWVRSNGRWPILDTAHSPQGDEIFITGDEAGNIIRYTFTC